VNASESAAEVARLLQLDHNLRSEADHVLRASGLGDMVRVEGYQAVGSYVMHTMAWRDLDFEREAESPDWAAHWQLGTRFARLPWVWKLNCTDGYRQPGGADQGLYWGLRLSDPDGGPVWKVDLWTARPGHFAGSSPHRARWAGMLTDESRFHILAIKEAVFELPEYRREMLSVHIYEAVLDNGVQGLDQFLQWWRARTNPA
jgi:hypothetical protein